VEFFSLMSVIWHMKLAYDIYKCYMEDVFVSYAVVSEVWSTFRTKINFYS